MRLDGTGFEACHLSIAIDQGSAKEVVAARFRQGEEDEVLTQCYRFGPVVYRTVYNGRDTTTSYFTVEGEDLSLFNANYPEV